MTGIARFMERCRLVPYRHQVYGIQRIIENPYFGLFDEMGAGKTLQTIVSALIMFELGMIDRVLIIAPASLRSSVWWDPELGELAKHLWMDLHSSVTEYHSRVRTWTRGPKEGPLLQWMVTNYEFVRFKERLEQVLPFCTEKTLLVLDESSAIKNAGSLQTKACMKLRAHCGRVLLLNGTPIANSPEDMYSQSKILHPSVLGCPTKTHFMSRYAIMGGYMVRNRPVQVIGWQNLEDLQKRMAPFVIRRLKTDCLDLPPKLPPVTLTATLTPDTWKVYREMRDDMVAWLSSSQVSSSEQIITKYLRLAQITSGFLGGVQTMDDQDLPLEYIEDPDRPAWMAPLLVERETKPAQQVVDGVIEVGREKLDLTLEWFAERLVEDPELKLMLWCRFRPELIRLLDEMKTKFPGMPVASIVGGQNRSEREYALRLLDPRTSPKGALCVGGTYGTGSKGLNCTASHTMLNVSYDYDLEKFLQSSDRVHRPGQTSPVSYFDIVAVGPKGQKTIDFITLMARRGKENMATWTQSAWVRALSEE